MGRFHSHHIGRLDLSYTWIRLAVDNAQDKRRIENEV
jgi:hypothetical protein